MSKIQAVTVMTLDGSLPEPDDVLTQWVMNHRKGFVHWREHCNAWILPHSILDLLCEKDRKNASFTYLQKFMMQNPLNFCGNSSTTTLWTNSLFICFLIPPERGIPYRIFFLFGDGSCIKPLPFPTASAA